VADDAVCGEPVSVKKNTEKYREIWNTGSKAGAPVSPEPVFREFLAHSLKKITGKAICDNREM
jgi:hypothetical protein